MDPTRAQKRVVLVRTEGPRNAGMALRAAWNFGPAELVFAAPRHGLLDDREFVLGAHGVPSPRDAVSVEPTLAAALAPVTHAVGFTARARQHRAVHRWPEAVAALRERAATRGERLALVFGNEAAGLSGDECDALHELVWIPTSAAHGSLNLAQAVAVVLAGLFDGAPPRQPSKKGRPLRQDEREFLVRHLEAELPRVIHTDAGRRDLRDSLRRLFAAAPLESRDARAWHRLLRALGSRARPEDLRSPLDPLEPDQPSQSASKDVDTPK